MTKPDPNTPLAATVREHAVRELDGAVNRSHAAEHSVLRSVLVPEIDAKHRTLDDSAAVSSCRDVSWRSFSSARAGLRSLPMSSALMFVRPARSGATRGSCGKICPFASSSVESSLERAVAAAHGKHVDAAFRQVLQRLADAAGAARLDVRHVGMLAQELLDAFRALSASAGGEVAQYPESQS